MEKELFDWEEWDIIDTMCFHFQQIVLKRAIGPFPEGTKFPYGSVDYENGRLSLYDEKNECHSFKLKLEVLCS